MRDRPSVIKSCYCERKFGDLGRVQSYVLESRRTRGCREYTPFWMQAKSEQNEMSYPPREASRDSAGELIGIQFTIKRFNFSRNEFHSIQLNPVTFYKDWTRLRRNRVRSIDRADGGAALSSTRSTYIHIYLN